MLRFGGEARRLQGKERSPPHMMRDGGSQDCGPPLEDYGGRLRFFPLAVGRAAGVADANVYYIKEDQQVERCTCLWATLAIGVKRTASKSSESASASHFGLELAIRWDSCYLEYCFPTLFVALHFLNESVEHGSDF